MAAHRARPRTPAPAPALSRRWFAVLLLLVALFAVLRGVHALAEPAVEVAVSRDQVVLVGIPGRTDLTAVDRTVLGAHLDDAEVGSVSIRPRYVGRCAAAGWTTLGAGRRAAVGDLCDPQVVDGRIADWPAYRAAAAASRGDAQLGTLAASVRGCITAVGPGAALAAARPDGSVPGYRTVAQFLADGMSTSCPTTLVDAGAASDEVIARLAADGSRALVVTGIGPVTGSDDPSLQVVYRLGTTFPGWLTSASTRREGIVTLTDLTRTLIDHDARPGAGVPEAVDGSPLAVDPSTLSVPAVSRHLAAVRALSESVVVGYTILGLFGAFWFVLLVVQVLRRRWALPRLVMAYGSVLSAVMMLTGAVPWSRAAHPGPVLGAVVVGWSVVLTTLVLVLARRLRVPAPVVGAAIAVAAFTVDAALGAPMQAGSMLNSRPIYGLRWYGFGNVTFATYATAGLFLAGWIAHRQLVHGHRRAAAVAVAVIGFGIVICEGWPSMGTDFGGVIALTPPVLWLLLMVSGVRITWPRLVAVGLSAVLAVGAISVLDWARGPDRRSHLGNFVQRVIDGDAVDVVARKAVASAETFISPLGVPSIIIGAVVWVAIFRYALPVLVERFSTLRAVLVAALATGVLGTLLNDGGASVFLAGTGVVAVTIAWFCFDRLLRGPVP
ncbi:hypothetical protein [uncultured Friedmanniella sp.]|uniref:hypothetical protein n=1 Tax=uncultured Friedmanniella sp. TaxID=335381 RepID=UPI0035CC4118